jgi:predicted RNA binding protein YcfA (HicA-like mRNA interferase family)
MPELPVLSGAEAVRAFERAGWRVDRQRGSHVVMLMHGVDISLLIPQHRELAPGTPRSLIRLSGMTVDQFIRLL